jgi:hypothetical protein
VLSTVLPGLLMSQIGGTLSRPGAKEWRSDGVGRSFRGVYFGCTNMDSGTKWTYWDGMDIVHEFPSFGVVYTSFYLLGYVGLVSAMITKDVRWRNAWRKWVLPR